MASEVKVKVGLESGAVATGLTKIKGQFAEFRSGLNSSLGGLLAFGAIEEGFRRLVEKGSRITDLADRFGVSTEALQRFGNVAEQDGANLESVAKAFNRLNVAREDALRGNKEATESFKAFGISAQEVASLSVEELFYKITDATTTAADRGTAYANVTKLMGRSAGELFATMERGTKAIREQGDALGVMSDETVRSLDKIGDELTGLKNRVFVFGGAFLTFFAKLAGAIGEVFGTALNTAERSVDTLGAALKLALGGHFIEAGKALASGVQDNLRATLKEAAEIRSGVANAFKDIGHEAFGLGSGSGKRVAEPAAKRVAAEERGPTAEEESRAKRIADLQERLAEIQRTSANDQLDTEARINALIQQRAALLQQAAGAKDAEKKLELQIKAAQIDKQIFDTQKSFEDRLDQKKKAPSVAADSLARIGGGGGVSASGSDANLREQRAHTTLLKEIEKNTRATQAVELKLK